MGIHTGQVIAGVAGRRPLSPTTPGKAVNMAARIEQSGEAGRINSVDPRLDQRSLRLRIARSNRSQE